MNAVGIDVSKGKSTVTIRQPGDVVVLAPRDYRHTQSSINDLITTIKCLEGETKVCMEHTGRYYEPVASWLSAAGIFVSAVNPWLIKDFGNESIRTPKTDKADAKKIARFALDRWAKLPQYSRMDELRNQLKTMNRQFGFYMDQKTAMKNNLIALLDQTFPGANSFFDSPARSDGSQKWVDFVYTYWHVDCVRSKSLEAFTEHYKNWCKRKGYNFSAAKAEEIYLAATDLIAVFPKDDNTKLLIRQAVAMLNVASETVETLRIKMDQTASQLPEYPVVMAMDGVELEVEEEAIIAIANKAIELGFADDMLTDEKKSADVDAFAFSGKAAENALMRKLVAKIRPSKNEKVEAPKSEEKPVEVPEPKRGRSVDSLMERLNLLKN